MIRAEVADLTELQAHYIAIADQAVAVGTVAAGLIIFLLAVIAFRGLASW